MTDNLLKIDGPVQTTSKSTVSSKFLDIPMAQTNPYDEESSPLDIYDFLPPDGSLFGLYSDPYATMLYHDPRRGNHNGRYWLNQRLEEHSFTQTEIDLLFFLSKHRVATRNQIHRVIFTEEDRVEKVKQFLKKCRQRGIICSFSWISPLNDGKKKPLVYGLTRVGADAAETLFHEQVKQDFMFQPIQFVKGQGPKMTTFYLDLVANELYAELKRIDRVINWERRKTIRLEDRTTHQPGAVFELIKDKGKFYTFWLETVRITRGWQETTIRRFQQTQQAYEKLSGYQRPARVIIIADSDSRIQYIDELTKTYMPDVNVRYTTDERLLQGLNNKTFLTYQNNKLVIAKMEFLSPDYKGMRASEFFASQEENFEDEDDFFEE